MRRSWDRKIAPCCHRELFSACVERNKDESREAGGKGIERTPKEPQLAFLISSAKISLTSDWYGNLFFSAVLRNQARTFGSNRMAISFLGPSPKVGLPTRRIRESCFSESSGMSEKSIFLGLVSFLLFPACPPRADDSRDLFIASSPCGVSYNQHSAQSAFGQAQPAWLDQ